MLHREIAAVSRNDFDAAILLAEPYDLYLEPHFQTPCGLRRLISMCVCDLPGASRPPWGGRFKQLTQLADFSNLAFWRWKAANRAPISFAAVLASFFASADFAAARAFACRLRCAL